MYSECVAASSERKQMLCRTCFRCFVEHQEGWSQRKCIRRSFLRTPHLARSELVAKCVHSLPVSSGESCPHLVDDALSATCWEPCPQCATPLSWPQAHAEIAQGVPVSLSYEHLVQCVPNPRRFSERSQRTGRRPDSVSGMAGGRGGQCKQRASRQSSASAAMCCSRPPPRP